MVVKLNLDRGTVTCVDKNLNFGPKIGFSTITGLQLTSNFWPENPLLKLNT
jgi:hypothetical protein